jgi:hypothetical protein
MAATLTTACRRAHNSVHSPRLPVRRRFERETSNESPGRIDRSETESLLHARFNRVPRRLRPKTRSVQVKPARPWR